MLENWRQLTINCQRGLSLIKDADSLRDVIEAVSLPAVQYGSVGSTKTCDPTAKMLSNIEKIDREISGLTSTHVRSKQIIEARMQEIEFLLSRVIELPPSHQEIIILGYYEGVKTWERVAKKVCLSPKTVSRRRDEAIGLIADSWIKEQISYVNLQK